MDDIGCVSDLPGVSAEIEPSTASNLPGDRAYQLRLNITLPVSYLVIGVPAEIEPSTASDRRKTKHKCLRTPAKNIAVKI